VKQYLQTEESLAVNMDLDTTGLHQQGHILRFTKRLQACTKLGLTLRSCFQKKTGQQISEYVTKMILIDIENYNTLGLRDCSFFYFDFGFENKELNI